MPKILVYQAASVLADPGSNLSAIEKTCRAVRTLDVEIAVFPELFISRVLNRI